jgi:hypothetical protein
VHRGRPLAKSSLKKTIFLSGSLTAALRFAALAVKTARKNARPLRGSVKNSFLACREARRPSALINGGNHVAEQQEEEIP